MFENWAAYSNLHFVELLGNFQIVSAAYSVEVGKNCHSTKKLKRVDIEGYIEGCNLAWFE